MQSTARESEDLLELLQHAATTAMYDRQDSNVFVSEESIRRSTAFKVYLTQQLRTAEDYRYQRRARYQDVLCRAKQAGVDPKHALKHLMRTESLYLRQRRCKTVINDYNLLSCLGRGGYGEVFLAKEKKTGQYVALKRMKKSVYTMTNFSSLSRSRHGGLLDGAPEEEPMSPRDAELRLFSIHPKSMY